MKRCVMHNRELEQVINEEAAKLHQFNEDLQTDRGVTGSADRPAVLEAEFQQVITGAETHLRRLTEILQIDSEFTRSADRLAVLEAESGKFDHVGYISQIHPWVPVVDVLDRVKEYTSAYNKHLTQQEMTDHRNFLANTINENLLRQRPKFEAMSAEEAMSYRLFLDNLSTNYLSDNQQLRETLVHLKGKTQVVIDTKSKTEIRVEFGKLEKSNHKIYQKLNAIDKSITRGQMLLQKTLVDIHKSAEGNKAEQQKQIAIVFKKLNELGITISSDLRRVVENNHEVREKINGMHQYLKSQAARQSREDKERQTQANYQGVAETFGFIGALGNQLKNKDLQRIGIIGGACVKIAQSVTALQGLGTFSLAALNPMMAIGMAGLSILGAFAKQGPDPNKLILEAIRGLSEQVHTLRREMHERFDHLEQMLGKIMTKIIEGFCQLRIDNLQVKTMLKQIFGVLKEGQDNLQGSINTISNKLQTFIDNQSRMGRREKLENIHEILNRVTSDFTLNKSEFKQAFDQLQGLIRYRQYAPMLVGQQNESPASMLRSLENDSCYEFFADFNISLLCRHVSDMTNNVIPYRELVNPILWVWQSLGLMYLAERRYPRDKKGEDFISESEFNKLQEIFKIGKELEKFCLSLQNESLLRKLLENYEQSAGKLQTELEKYIRQEEQKTTNQLNAYWQTFIDASSETKLDAYRQQVIHTTDNVAGKNWFTGYCENHHPNGLHSIHIGDRDCDYVQDEIKKYQDNRQKSINAAKEKHLLMLRSQLLEAGRNEMPLRSCQFNFFAEPTVERHFYFGFVYPEDRNHPILPMAAGYRPYIPSVVYHAEWLGLGQIIIKYRIQEDQFTVTTHFIMPGQSLQIGPAFTSPYKPGIYQGNEAIWWFWAGGNYSLNGEAGYQVVRVRPQAEGNVWTSYVRLPACNEVNGLVDTLAYHPEQGELKGIDQLHEKILNKQQQLRSVIRSNMRDLILNNEQHPLTLAMIDFSNNYYLLRAALTLGFHDEVMTSPQWKYFSPESRHLPNLGVFNNGAQAIEERRGHFPDIVSLRNRDDFICFMETYQNMSPLQFFVVNLAYIRGQLKIDIETLVHRRAICQVNYKLLSGVLRQFQELLAYYELIKVPQNQLTEEINDVDALEQLRLMKYIGKKALGIMTPEQRQQLMISLQEDEGISLDHQGIARLCAPVEHKPENKRAGANLETRMSQNTASLFPAAKPASKSESKNEKTDADEVLVNLPDDDLTVDEHYRPDKFRLSL